MNLGTKAVYMLLQALARCLFQPTKYRMVSWTDAEGMTLVGALTKEQIDALCDAIANA